MRRGITGAIAIAATLGAVPALAHPHVFAESRMEIVGTPDGKLAAVRNIWRMDELFSSSVVFDFDANANGILDADELEKVGGVVHESIAEWGFYTFVSIGGRDVKMLPPDTIRTLWQDGQLVMFFEMKAGEPVDLKATPVTFATFDDSFFVAFDYADQEAFALLDMPAGCTRAFTIPDEDEAAAKWMDEISMLKPDQTIPDDGVDYSRILATHAEVKCQ